MYLGIFIWHILQLRLGAMHNLVSAGIIMLRTVLLLNVRRRMHRRVWQPKASRLSRIGWTNWPGISPWTERLGRDVITRNKFDGDRVSGADFAEVTNSVSAFDHGTSIGLLDVQWDSIVSDHFARHAGHVSRPWRQHDVYIVQWTWYIICTWIICAKGNFLNFSFLINFGYSVVN